MCLLESLAAGLGTLRASWQPCRITLAQPRASAALTPTLLETQKKPLRFPTGREVKSPVVGVPAPQSVALETQHSIQRTRPS